MGSEQKGKTYRRGERWEKGREGEKGTGEP